MKKIVAFCSFVALSLSVYADGLTIFSCGVGLPGRDEPQLLGLGISPNGKYVCGAIESGAGVFVADCGSGNVKWILADEEGGQLRNIDNNGVAIGYLDDNGALFSYDTGEGSMISVPDGYRFVLGESLSNDGTIMVGSLSEKSFNTVAAYCNTNKGDEWIKLPYPSDEELGELKDKLNSVTAAKQVSGDGKVIIGFLGSFGIPIVWIMNENGEYEADLFLNRYIKVTEDDVENVGKELYSISAEYLSVSNNGKYLSMVGMIKDEKTGVNSNVPVIYDTENKSLKIYKEPQNIDIFGSGLYPQAICDDGTFVGSIGKPYFASSGSFIMKAGQTQAETFNNAFPSYAEKFGEADELGFNMPIGISADGKYILGYIFYCEDYYNAASDAYYLTYVISTESSSVDSMKDVEVSGDEMIYSIDGRKLSRISKGLNIVRGSDGKFQKIMK